MKAVVLLGGNERGTLEIPNVPEPKLGTQELLIRALMHSFFGYRTAGIHKPSDRVFPGEASIPRSV